MIGASWDRLEAALGARDFPMIVEMLSNKTADITADDIGLLIKWGTDWVLNERFYHFRYPLEEFLQAFATVDPAGMAERRGRAMLSSFQDRELAAAEARASEAQRFRERERVRSDSAEARVYDERKKEAERHLAAAQRIELERQRKVEAEYALAAAFNSDFIGTDRKYLHGFDGVLSPEVVRRIKLHCTREWFESRSPRGEREQQLPSEEQYSAISSVNGNVQVVARAGSGKTLTLVNRSEFLANHCGVSPSQIMLLAFNKKAVIDIRRKLLESGHPEGASFFHQEIARLNAGRQGGAQTSEGVQERALDAAQKRAGLELPHVMTFHALAYAVVHPEESLIHDSPDQGDQTLSRVVQDIVDEHIRSEKHYALIRHVMLEHFRQAWDQIEAGRFAQTPEILVQYRRSLPTESIAGEYLKSRGEKIIADFLFEHGVPYRYEQSHYWNGTNYRPDFTIPGATDAGVVIEYFGLENDSDYDEMSGRKRAYWAGRPDWTFLEFTPHHITIKGADRFREKLGESLRAAGVKLARRSDEEIWELVKVRAIDRFTSNVVAFIGRCRKGALDPDTVQSMIDRTAHREGLRGFWNVAAVIYRAYLARLAAAGEEDFDGLLERAATMVENGSTLFRRKSGSGDLAKLSHVLIDEYQDFSLLFHRLISAVRKRNSALEVFCVGDDWQAINAFAGADLRFFTRFNEFMPGNRSAKVHLSANRRSTAEVVRLGNLVMAGNGSPATPTRGERGELKIADLTEYTPTTREIDVHGYDEVSGALLRLIRDYAERGRRVALLSRTRSPPYRVATGISDFGSASIEALVRKLRTHLPPNHRNLLTGDTTHSFKGRQEQAIIVIDALARSYPMIHPDWVFSQIFGDDLESITEQERRLFYVAITRAEYDLTLLTRGGKESPFLSELLGKCKLKKVVWSELDDHKGEVDRVLVQVGNKSQADANATVAIKDLLKAHGYKWQSVGWPCWWKSVAVADYSLETIAAEGWTERAVGVEVRVDGVNGSGKERYVLMQGKWTRLGH